MSEEIRNLSSSVNDLKDAFGSRDNERVENLLNEIVKSTEELKTINEKMKSEQKEDEQAKTDHKSHQMFKRIRIVSRRRLRKIKRISKEKLNNFKQRLKMLASTRSFQSILLSAKEAGLKLENKVLEGISDTKDAVLDAKDYIKDKASLIKNIAIVQKDLTKLTIQTKVGSAKKTIKHVSKEGVERLKNKINDVKLTTTTYVGASALYSRDALVDKKDQIKDKFANMKEKLVDKALLVNYRIRTKLASKKNIIVRKTGMEIALFKDDVKSFLKRAKETINKKYNQAKAAISDKYNKVFNMDDEALNKKKQEIEILKQRRSKLASQIVNGNDSFEMSVEELHRKKQELEELRHQREALVPPVINSSDDLELEGTGRSI